MTDFEEYSVLRDRSGDHLAFVMEKAEIEVDGEDIAQHKTVGISYTEE